MTRKDWQRPVGTTDPGGPFRRGEPRAEWTTCQWEAWESAMAEAADILAFERSIGDAKLLLRRRVADTRRARGARA